MTGSGFFIGLYVVAGVVAAIIGIVGEIYYVIKDKRKSRRSDHRSRRT